MPLPLIPIGIAIALALGLSVGSYLYANWDDIVIAWKGKTVGVLGARLTGKSHLIHFMTTGSIPAVYEQTAVNKTTKARRKLRDLELVIKEGVDVGGGESFHGVWKSIFQDSEVVLYLFRIDWLLSQSISDKSNTVASTKKNSQGAVREPDYAGRMRKDLKLFNKWSKKCEFPPDLILVGTFADMDPDFLSNGRDTVQDYFEAIAKNPLLSELQTIAASENLCRGVVMGSMKDLASTEELTHRIFSQLADG